MLAAFSVAPSGGENSDASVHDAVAAAVEIVRRSGLSHRTDSMFTTIEGEWDEVFAVIKEATEAVGEYGTRVSLVSRPISVRDTPERSTARSNVWRKRSTRAARAE